MLTGVSMKLDGTRAALLLLLVPALARCEPLDEAPPPQAPSMASPGPANAPPPPPPPAPASQAPPPPPALAGGSEPASAAREYTIGEDNDAYDDSDPAALRDFHAALDPNGSWVEDPKYGTLWVPSPAAVGPDFTPYATAGHWAYDDDWVWASDYPWGWAPFHYGRWVMVEGRGWAWVPGRAYRGAWVTWGVNDGYTYLGWAPMAPAFFWFGGLAVGWGGYIGPSWVYCPRGAVFAPNVGAHVVTGAAAGPIAAGMRTYVTATPGVGAGPSPQKLGFTSAQIPRPSGAEAAHVAQARAFSRPSTGKAFGASTPTRVAMPVARSAVSTHAAFTSARPSITAAPRASEGESHAATPSVSHAAAPHAVAPASRSSSWHSTGGGGGGGHHR